MVMGGWVSSNSENWWCVEELIICMYMYYFYWEKLFIDDLWIYDFKIIKDEDT
jgi:hypothetical protein